MKIADKIFDTDGRPYIMGILNVTPDSFSDGDNTIRLHRHLLPRRR